MFDMTGIGKRFRARVRAVGLLKPKPDNLTLHSLRHSFGTYLQSSYKDLNITKDLMRHKTVAMTLRYAHASDGAKRAAVLAASVSEQDEKGNERESLSKDNSPSKSSKGTVPTA